jgi:hypothetical protein
MPPRGLTEPVELQVDLDPFLPRSEERQEFVVVRHPHPVRVDQDPNDRSSCDLVEDPVDVGVGRRLAAAHHHDVEPPALAGEPDAAASAAAGCDLVAFSAVA